MTGTSEQQAAAQLAQEAIAAAQRKAADDDARERLSPDELAMAATFEMRPSEWEEWKTKDQPGTARRVWEALDSESREEVVTEHIRRSRPVPTGVDPELVRKVRERLSAAND